MTSETLHDGEGICISYIPIEDTQVHNANTSGGEPAGSDVFAYTGNETYRDLAQKAIQYTAQHQRADSSWYYGEKANHALGRQFPYRIRAGLFQVLCREHGR